MRAYTFADPEHAERIEAARRGSCHHLARFALDDLEDLMGYAAAEANHSKDRKLRKKLDDLFVRLQDVMDTYEEKKP